MHVVVVGVGAVGGVIAARLALAGHRVTGIARGRHLAAIEAHGLRLVSPDDDVAVPLAIASDARSVEWTDDTVAIVAVKSQDTSAVLDGIAAAAPDAPVVCAQNGVSNEREALRRFERVYGITVMLPSGHLEPGVVIAGCSPVPGILDIGRYPEGIDETAGHVAAALRDAGFECVPRDDIMRWKHTKLLMNLGNAVQAVCGKEATRTTDLVERARAEGRACLDAAGIAYVSDDEDKRRRGDILQGKSVPGHDRGGSSSWQSLARATGAIETDHLNGEIVLLGRLHGIPTPVNEALQRHARRMATARDEPGTTPVAVIEADIQAATIGL